MMTHIPDRKTAIVNRQKDGSYQVNVEGEKTRRAPLRLHLLFKFLAADYVTKIIYTDATETWIMDLAPFHMNKDNA